MLTIEDCQRVIDLGPEMVLRVHRPDGTPGESRRVRNGLTIGRAAASDLAVNDPDANLIHARVAAGIGGGWDLVGVGRSKLFLDDGGDGAYPTHRVTLTPGVVLHVGRTRVTCELAGSAGRLIPGEGEFLAYVTGGATPSSIMPPPLPHDREAAGTVAAIDTTAEPSIAMPKLVVCPSCYKDVSAVPVVARFCPKCGVRLPARYLIPPEESSPLYPVYKALRDELSTKLKDESPRVASSMVILAYANAMLNLGWKYEHGRGLMRNVEEAARCYEKASKLSDAWARP